MKTIRQEMLLLLEHSPQGARELSQALHISEKDLYDHLEHLNRSLRASGRRLIIEPARCRDCDFVFTERKRFNPPGHCPRCKKSHIQRPLFRLK
ncbi:transcriptional regulator [Desulfogranum mediterraneum]|uniref:transcriptional regulator n=1 Tax=Desulfogranum mediterraneum TaxID=160661 RepID=UPI0004067760|nr:transcriptional regulator [Desulfogranum mediterraneum]